MEIIADVIIIAIVLISVTAGYRKGLVRTLFRCLTVAAAIAVSFYTGPMLGDFIKSTDEYTVISGNVSEKVSDYFDSVVLSGIEDAEKSKTDFEETPLAETLSRLGFDSEKMLEHYKTAVVSGAENVKDEYVEGLTRYILSCLANALGHLVMFLAALIVIKLIGVIAEKLFDLPVLKIVNKAGGGLLGAVFGIVIAYIVCMAIETLLPYIPENPVFYMGMAEKTYLYRYFVNFNPMIFLLLG